MVTLILLARSYIHRGPLLFNSSEVDFSASPRSRSILSKEKAFGIFFFTDTDTISVLSGEYSYM